MHNLRSRNLIIVIIVLAGALALLFAVIPRSSVSAEGAIGTGGDASGGTGYAQTRYGYGWYNFPSDGSVRPQYMRNGGDWTTARNRCVTIGADRVLAFIIFQAAQTVATSVVYDYKSSWPIYTGYRGNNGYPWVTIATAQSRYYLIDAATRVGYTWGSNVGWFCYYSRPQSATITGSASVSSSSVVVNNPVTFTNYLTTSNLDLTGNGTFDYAITSSGSSALPAAGVSSYSNLSLDPARSTTGGRTFTFTPTSVGRYCRTIRASGAPSYVVYSNNSATACVDVVAPIVWDLVPSATISRTGVASTTSDINAFPTQTINWNHRVTNNGPNATTTSSSYDYINSADLGTLNSTDQSIAAGLADGASASFSSSHLVVQDDVGKSLCRATRVFPYLYNNGVSTFGPRVSTPAVCANIPYNYNLIPSVQVDTNDAIEIGAQYIVTPEVTNNSPNTNPGTKSNPTEWQLTELQFASTVNPIPNATTTSTSISTTTPCSAFIGEKACTTINSGSGVVFNANSTSQAIAGAAKSVTMSSDLNVGDKVCYVLSLKPYTSNIGSVNNDWRHSIVRCLTVTKKPKVQIWGGDVKVGRSFQSGTFNTTANITTSITTKSSLSYGSWAEYALVAPGLISGTGSGSALNGGLASDVRCDYSHLSFSNAFYSGSTLTLCSTNSSPIGRYSFKKTTIPNVAAKYPITSSTSLITSADSLATKNGVYTYSNTTTPLNISGGTIQGGSWVVINAPSASITISGNITYANGPFTSLSQIPQVIIIAKNIYIAPGVTNIDAWLIADSSTEGVINTCSPVPITGPALVPTDCGGKLTINGPVMANKLILKRTAGSGVGAASGDPAEVINLRADAYLWAYNQAIGSGQVWSVYSTSIPPRL